MSRRSPAPIVMTIPLLLLLGVTRAGAELECPQPHFDKGEVRSGVPLSHTFRITNQGPEVIEITDVRPSCGCLAPELRQRRLQPGESSELLLEVNTLTQPAGANNWRVTLRYQMGREQRELPLFLAARIV